MYFSDKWEKVVIVSKPWLTCNPKRQSWHITQILRISLLNAIHLLLTAKLTTKPDLTEISPPEITAERTNWVLWEWPLFMSEGEGVNGNMKVVCTQNRQHWKSQTTFFLIQPPSRKRGLILLTTHVLRNVLMQSFQEMDPLQVCLDNIDKQFKPYNRER